MKRLELPSVTAICIDGRPLTDALRNSYAAIVNYMRSRIDFGAVKLVMTSDPKIEGTEFCQIDELQTLQDYSNFCISEMHKYVETEHCLIFQEDGFVLNPEMWRPIFLQYDYIGAPWPPIHPWPEPGRMDRRVGNGGFSMRSKKLLEFIKDFKTDINEDIAIVSTYRDELDSAGFKFAPLGVAIDFSIETQFLAEQSVSRCFGFHGKYRVEEAMQIMSKKSGLFQTN